MMWDGQILPERVWDSLRLSPGNRLVVREVPQGHDTGRTIALIAVAVVASWAGYAAIQAGASAAAG